MQCKVDQVITETQRKGENCRAIEGRVNVSQSGSSKTRSNKHNKHSSVSLSAIIVVAIVAMSKKGIRLLSRLPD
jgi:hypothetical protein